MLYVPPTGSTDPNASYIGKNVAAGTQGSKVPPRAIEGPQREILAVIGAAQALGLDAPSGADLAQMLKAVRSGLLGYFVATGSPDAVVIAPQPIYTALLPGMRFRVKIPGTAPSTTVAPSLTVSGISAPIRLRGGGAPAVGDVVNGTILTFDIDDAGNARFVTTAPSEVSNTTSIVNILNAKKIAGGQLFAFPVGGNTSSDLSVSANTTFSVGECRGAGGGGGGAAGTASAGSGGGGGGNALKVGTATVDTVLTITTGVPGVGGAAGGGNGTSGGTTSVVVKSGNVQDTAGNNYGPGKTFCAATGGGGGYGASGSATAGQSGSGGVGGNGDVNQNGDGGGLPQGQYTNNTYLGGLGGASPGSGGSPSANQGAAGNSSSAAGVGGNGASNNAPGANGAQGSAKIYK